MITDKRFPGLLVAALSTGLLVACGRGGPETAAAAAPGASAAAPAASAPPVAVSTVLVAQRAFPVTVRATGTVAPVSTVDVKAQIASTILQSHAKEGQFVKAGELLFTLDSRPDEANLGKAKAQLARDQAMLADARRQYDRSRDLLAQNFVAQGAVDTAQANMEAQAAAVQQDQAAIDAVKVNLSYARVTAPSPGRVGAITVYPGTSVSPGGSPLVTITQLDPIQVAFNLPQRYVTDALKLLAGRSGGGKVTAMLPEGHGSRDGRMQFVDSQIDPNSGTVRVKAGFANDDHALWPGAYVDVVVTVQTIADAIVIPQAAIVPAPHGNVVFVVGPDKHAVLRPISVLQSSGDDAVVSGVTPGERIVVDGRQNLRQGTPLLLRDGAPGAPGRAGRAASGPMGPTSAARGAA